MKGFIRAINFDYNSPKYVYAIDLVEWFEN